MERNKNWYIVYTRSGNEKKFESILVKRGLEAYSPLKKANFYPLDRRKLPGKPLFPSFVFVKTSIEDLGTIRAIEGFLGLVYWLSKPAIVSNDEIDTIKKFLSEYDHVSVEKSEVDQNDKVRILNGPLVLWEGNVVEVMTNTVKILLPSLGYFLVAEIKKENNTLNNAHLHYDSKNVIL